MTNIVQVTDIQGETVAVSTIGPGTSPAATSAVDAVAVLSGAAAAGSPLVYTTYKVNSLLIANAGSADATVSVQFNAITVSGPTNNRTTFVHSVVVPAGATLDVLSGPVYLNHNGATQDVIEVFATGADVNALVSYEAIKSTTA